MYPRSIHIHHHFWYHWAARNHRWRNQIVFDRGGGGGGEDECSYHQLQYMHLNRNPVCLWQADHFDLSQHFCSPQNGWVETKLVMWTYFFMYHSHQAWHVTHQGSSAVQLNGKYIGKVNPRDISPFLWAVKNIAYRSSVDQKIFAQHPVSLYARFLFILLLKACMGCVYS